MLSTVTAQRDEVAACRVSSPDAATARLPWASGGTGGQGLGRRREVRQFRGAERGAGRPNSPSLLLLLPVPSLRPSFLPPSKGRGCGRDKCARGWHFFVFCVSQGLRHLCENDGHCHSEPDDPEVRQVLRGPGNFRLVPTYVLLFPRRCSWEIRSLPSCQYSVSAERREGRGLRQKWAGSSAGVGGAYRHLWLLLRLRC